METMKPRPVTCLIADDHPAVLDSITHVLVESGIDVVAQVRDGTQALRELERDPPDVAVVDVGMPGLTGVEVARAIGDRVPIILYTGEADRALVVEALDAGARGFVLKEAPLDDLVRAIEVVAGGGVYVDPVLAGMLATREVAQRLPLVSPREREVLALLSEGLKNEEIATRLGLSPDTVRAHIRNAMRKLDADTRTHAVALALRQSLIG